MKAKNFLGLFILVVLLVSSFPLASAATLGVSSFWVVNGQSIPSKTLTLTLGETAQYNTFVNPSDDWVDYNLDIVLQDVNYQKIKDLWNIAGMFGSLDTKVLSVKPTAAGTYYISSFAYDDKNSQGYDYLTLIVKNPEVLGCTNPAAVNYNPSATKDDGSCKIAICTPGAIQTITQCWDLSVKDYKVCSNDGLSWVSKSNTCPVVPPNNPPSYHLDPVGDDIVYVPLIFVFPVYNAQVGTQLRPILAIGEDVDVKDTLTFSAGPAEGKESDWNNIKGWLKILPYKNRQVILSGTPTIEGEFTFSLSVTDGKETYSWPVIFRVSKSNDAPLMVPTPNQTVYENTERTFTVKAVDEGTTLTYEAKNLLPGMNFDSTTGKFTYKPDYTVVQHNNTKKVLTPSFRAFNGKYYSDWINVNITVMDVNRLPVAVSNDYNALAGKPIDVTLKGFDNDAEDVSLLVYNINTQPLHGTITQPDANHKVTYTSEPGYYGIDSFSYYLVDQMGGKSANGVITFRVTPEAVVCEDPSMAVPVGKVNGVPTDYSMTLLLFPTYTVNVGDYVEVTWNKEERTVSVSYVWETTDGHTVPFGLSASEDKIQGKFTQAGYYVAQVTVTSACGSTFTWPIFFTVKDKSQLCIPGTTENLTSCPDGSVKDYRVCAADGMSWINHSNVCVPVEVLGCTDPEANNYNSAANKDDGSCTYDVQICVPGTTEILTKCWDASTKDYRVCAADGMSWMNHSNTCPTQTILGCTDSLAWNYNPFATQDDGSCLYINGCTDSDALNYNPNAVKDDGSCTYDVKICVPGTIEILTKCWDASTKDYRVCAADGMSWINHSNTCPDQPVQGCMDPKAKNYNPLATEEDGSCTYYVLGCMDKEAVNYNAAAEKDDHSCVYPQARLELLEVHPAQEVLTPGEYTAFDVKVRNSGNVDLQDLEVNVYSYDLGFKSSYGTFDLHAGKTKGVKLYATIPYEAQPGEYILMFTVGNDQIHEVAYRQVIVQ